MLWASYPVQAEELMANQRLGERFHSWLGIDKDSTSNYSIKNYSLEAHWMSWPGSGAILREVVKASSTNKKTNQEDGGDDVFILNSWKPTPISSSKFDNKM